MKYYSHTGYEIQIGHFAGQSRIVSKDVLEDGKNRPFWKPYNVEIISIITKSYLNDDNTALDYQMRRCKVDYINPAKNYIGKWNNTKKVKFILKALKQCKTEYVLILDGADVCIISDLSDIVERFKTYDKDIIFNATIRRFPQVEIDHIPNRELLGKYCYFNAGCCIGKTKALLEFYQECQKVIRTDRHKNPSEQYYVRQVFNKHQDKVFIDYDCKIFQVWHNPEYEYSCIVR